MFIKIPTNLNSRWIKISLNLVTILSISILVSSPILADTTTDTGTLRANDRKTQINLRSDPNISSKKVGYGLPGDKVILLEFAKGADNEPRYPWIKVKFVQSGAIGWIRGDFIQTSLTILTANDPKAQISLRFGPSISSKKVGYGLPGDKVIVLGCETGPDKDRTPWIKVKFPKSEATGWIRGDFIIVPLTNC